MAENKPWYEDSAQVDKFFFRTPAEDHGASAAIVAHVSRGNQARDMT
jgi:hypothetical protein